MVIKMTKYSFILLSEMTDTFLNQIQVDAAQEMGISLPLPEDRFFECFYQQYNDKI